MKNILIGERYRKKLEIPLNNQGISPFWVPENPNVDSRLSSHIDLSVFISQNTVIIANYLKHDLLVKYLTDRGYTVLVSNEKQGAAYPNDVNMCAVEINGKLLHNTKFTDAEILKLGYKSIHVNQGYARCTALKINDNSLITADNGIAAAARAAGIDILKIDNSGIDLEGFDCGFIGGAAFRLEKTIYFTGNINLHPDAHHIKEFIEKRGLNIYCLTDDVMFDIGGAIWI